MYNDDDKWEDEAREKLTWSQAFKATGWSLLPGFVLSLGFNLHNGTPLDTLTIPFETAHKIFFADKNKTEVISESPLVQEKTTISGFSVFFAGYSSTLVETIDHSNNTSCKTRNAEWTVWGGSKRNAEIVYDCKNL